VILDIICWARRRWRSVSSCIAMFGYFCWDNRFHKRGLLPTHPVEPTKLMPCASVVRDNRTLYFSYSWFSVGLGASGQDIALSVGNKPPCSLVSRGYPTSLFDLSAEGHSAPPSAFFWVLHVLEYCTNIPVFVFRIFRSSLSTHPGVLGTYRVREGEEITR